MGERCTGHCCKRFHLPFKPEEIDSKLRELNSDGTGPRFIDGPFVADMIIHVESVSVPESPDMGHFYTCKHFKNGNCSVYENRPRMCSEYPYGKECQFKECEWDEGRSPAPNAKLTKLEII